MSEVCIVEMKAMADQKAWMRRLRLPMGFRMHTAAAIQVREMMRWSRREVGRADIREKA